ncbi:hypothetical protein Dimus_038499 [Dionaea muscipula]
MRADAAADSLHRRRKTLAELLPKQLEHAKNLAIDEFIDSRGFLQAVIPLCLPYFRNGFNLCKAQAAQIVKDNESLASNKALVTAIQSLAQVKLTIFERVPEGKLVTPPLEPWDDNEGSSDPLSILLKWSDSEPIVDAPVDDATLKQ